MKLLLPKISLAIVRKVILLVLLATLIFGGGYFLGRKGFVAELKYLPRVTISREVPPDKSDIDFSLFWKVWDTLQTSYFDKSKLNSANMVYGAISGMVSAIGDPYTVFLPPAENKVVQEDLNGSFEGVGIQIGFKGTQLAVIAPLPGSPAEEVGVKAGDFIIGIKDEEREIDRGTVGISLPEAVKAIRGKAGTKITLTILREGGQEPMVFEITRRRLEVPSLVLSFSESDTIAHIRLLKFGAETEVEWKKAVNEIAKKGNIKGVILDVRNNPGGYLQGAVDLASEFLPLGSTVVIEERSDGNRTEFKAQRNGGFTKFPVVVLINKGSASASEILAGALRDIRKIQLVGEASFGKGTIQEPQQLNGSGLHITIAKWLTPSGVWVNEKGLEPDVKIEDKPETAEDEQLQEATKLLISKFGI